MDNGLNEKCFLNFIDLIHDLTGITISKNRTSMVEGRLRRRLNKLNLHEFEDYLQFVKNNKDEQIKFVDLVTTNETYFFRTQRIWDYIENQLLPNWYANSPHKVFTAWSAAASSGEEAHSLGILCQLFKEKHPQFTYQIIGTDISCEMVQKCSEGIYTGKSIDQFAKQRPDIFEKYMTTSQNGFEVSRGIKARIHFHQHNLFEPLKEKDHFDLVLLRNVLIYFTLEDQEKVLSVLASNCNENSTLIIGESESLAHIKTPFKSLEPLIYKLNK